MQKGGIVLGLYAVVEDAIISKEKDCTIDGIRQGGAWSLMYTKNSMGPRTVPSRGTPERTGVLRKSCITSDKNLCDLPQVQTILNPYVVPLMPYQLYCRRAILQYSFCYVYAGPYRML